MADAFTPRFVDLVRNIITTTGTGNITLGPSVSGFDSFADAIKAGETFYYSVIGVDRPSEREVGRGTMMPDGTIKREPLEGEKLTAFTAGTKTIALVAAAEWFEKIQAGGGSNGGPKPAAVAADRSELAAMSPAFAAAVLSELGREGLFVWNGSDLAAMVAADTQQGIYVAPKAAPTGASGAWVRKSPGGIDPRWFGLVANDGGSAAKSANTAALVNLLRFLKLSEATEPRLVVPKAELSELGAGNLAVSIVQVGDFAPSRALVAELQLSA